MNPIVRYSFDVWKNRIPHRAQKHQYSQLSLRSLAALSNRKPKSELIIKFSLYQREGEWYYMKLACLKQRRSWEDSNFPCVADTDKLAGFVSKKSSSSSHVRPELLTNHNLSKLSVSFFSLSLFSSIFCEEEVRESSDSEERKKEK